MSTAPTSPSNPKHRSITAYDDSTIRRLLARLDKLVAERDQLAHQQPAWETEAAQIEAQINPLTADAKKVELLQLLRLKLSMCGPRLRELESSIGELEGKVAAEFRGSLEPAVMALCHHERERLIAAIAGELLPHFGDVRIARAHAVKTPRFTKASITWFSSLHADPVKQARRAIELLDRYNTTGSLQQAAIKEVA